MDAQLLFQAVALASVVGTSLTLAATCGLRAFLPPLVVAFFGLLGWVQLAEHAQWMASVPAVLVFGTLFAAETGADKVPGIDHTLDGIGLVVKPLAATLVAVTTMRGVDPALALMLGGALGGGAAMALGVAKGRLRLLASRFAKGGAGVVLSCAEDPLALMVAVAACVFVPSAALMLTGIAVVLVMLEAFGRRASWSRLAALPTIVPI